MLRLQAVKRWRHVAFKWIWRDLQVSFLHATHLNPMLTAWKIKKVRQGRSLCVCMRNSVSMETDGGGTQEMHVSSTQPLSVLTDHNMKMQPIALTSSLSILLFLFAYVWSYLFLCCFPSPTLLISASNTLWERLRLLACLLLTLACEWQEEENKTVEKGFLCFLLQLGVSNYELTAINYNNFYPNLFLSFHFIASVC